jgi:hypothetical protein
MRRAVEALATAPAYALVDGNYAFSLPCPVKTVVKGDGLSCSIAAASILAKVARDRLMAEMDALYPGYGFASHKGYNAPIHIEALVAMGPCEIHRRAWRPVRMVLAGQDPRLAGDLQDELPFGSARTRLTPRPPHARHARLRRTHPRAAHPGQDLRPDRLAVPRACWSGSRWTWRRRPTAVRTLGWGCNLAHDGVMIRVANTAQPPAMARRRRCRRLARPGEALDVDAAGGGAGGDRDPLRGPVAVPRPSRDQRCGAPAGCWAASPWPGLPLRAEIGSSCG